MSVIEAAAACSLLQSSPDTLVVDVRTPAEFEGAHIPGAINLPLDQVDAHLQRIVSDAGGRLVLVCQSGARAQRCQRTLASAGLTDSLVLAGGMNAWAAAGGAVTVGRQRWGLERQVRLAAGSMVATAILASVWWPPARFAAGLIGLGLAFAAVTNTCAMGMLLAKLPYNRPKQTADVDTSLALLSGRAR